MDNLVDAYLEFKAVNVEKYLKCVLKHYDSKVRLTNKLIDIVYDYLNEILLAEDYSSNSSLTQMTGLKLDRNRNSLLALFIDYGATSRMALKSKDVQDTYLFIIDTILFFINVECLTNTSKFGCDSFERACSKAFKNDEYENEIRLKEIFHGFTNEFIAIFNNSLKKNNKFNATVRDNAFNLNYSKLDTNLALVNFDYHNDKLNEYDAKEVNFVKDKYLLDMFQYSLELITLDLIEDALMGEKKRIIFCIPNDITLKKSFLKMVVDETKIFAIKKNIILVVNYSATEKDDTLLDSLYDKGYDLGVNKDTSMPKNFDLGNAKFLLLEYYNDNEFRNILNKKSDDVELVITNELSKLEKLECLGMGIKYFIKK